MLTLNQKQLKKLMDITALAARLNELKKLEGYVPSGLIAKRKGIIKAQLTKLTGKESEKEETTVRIQIEIPEEKVVSKKEKSFGDTIKNLLAGKFNEVKEDDEDDVLLVFKSLLPADSRPAYGKVVTEI